jgi:hypothetical protein
MPIAAFELWFSASVQARDVDLSTLRTISGVIIGDRPRFSDFPLSRSPCAIPAVAAVSMVTIPIIQNRITSPFKWRIATTDFS